MNQNTSTGARRWLITRGSVKRLIALFFLIAAFLTWAYFSMIRMPGQSFRGPLPPLTESQAALSAELRRDVAVIGGEIGPREMMTRPRELARAADWIEASLSQAGHPQVRRHQFTVYGAPVVNLSVEIKGSARPPEIVIVGAHYDSVPGSPAANDNGSGVAATLALARMLGGTAAPRRTLRFVFFVNEEPPYFQTDDMGSRVYARDCRQRGENIVAMLSLETIGCYSDAPGSQAYPIKGIDRLYPDTGNFIAFVGNWGSRALVRRTIDTFRARAKFPSEGAALPGWIAGVGWSDHWSFWQEGYAAVMVTDTAPFRYGHYHGATDTPDKLDYERMARVVEGLHGVVDELVNPK